VNGCARIAAAVPVPLVAIGGINPERVPAVMAAGARGVAVIGAICEAHDPRAAARALRAAVDAARLCHEKGPEMDSALGPEPTFTIVVNGKPREVAAGATVHDLLASRKLADSMAIVERNGIILRRDSYATTVLSAGDQLEIVHAVGGG
jgi:thiamine biosynthesis protein ThiS